MANADYSVARLRVFVNELQHISRLCLRTAQNTTMGVRAILHCLGLPDDLDVRTIDRDSVLAQFEAAEADRLADHSRTTYKAGFCRGLDLFLRWQEGVPDWDTLGWSGRRRSPPPAHAIDRSALIVHVFPLRPGSLIIRFSLPMDLTTAEADRLTDFIRSLAS
jgi:hypothetical protein